MMKLKQTISRFVIVIIAACLGAVLLLTLPTGWKALDIATGSMRPGLPPGTLVIVHSVPDTSLRVGDVITYKSLLEPGKLITHRIIQLKSVSGKIPAFIAKGDANSSPDPEVVAGQVVGTVVFHLPYVGRLFNYTHSPIGLGILVILPGFLIISYEIELLIRALRVPDLTPVRDPVMSIPTAQAKARRRQLSLDGIVIRRLLILGLAISAIGLLGLESTRANLTSNKVVLANNHLAVASPLPSPSGCSGTVSITNTGPGSTNTVTCTSNTSTSTSNNTTINVINSNTQSATGSNASNSNSTSNTVKVSNF